MGKTIRKTDENWERVRQEKEKRSKKSESKKKFLHEKPERNDREKYSER